MEEFCEESVSLVQMFDDLMTKQEEARVERNQTGPEFFLKVLHTTALAEARETKEVREARDQILLLEKEIKTLRSRVSPITPFYCSFGIFLSILTLVSFSRFLVCLSRSRV